MGWIQRASQSVFTSQVALDLQVQRQRVMIVSLEMDPPDTMARMTRRRATGGEPKSRDGGHVPNGQTTSSGCLTTLGTCPLTTRLRCAATSPTKHKGQHIFLDSMMMICASEESLDEQKALCHRAGATGTRNRAACPRHHALPQTLTAAMTASSRLATKFGAQAPSVTKRKTVLSCG